VSEFYGIIQVLVPGPVRNALEAWLETRGMELYPIPCEEDLPTFGIRRS
jgi:hypothetical protein